MKISSIILAVAVPTAVLACDVSTLGYDCSMELSEGAELHYSATSSKVSYALSIETTGFVALGFSIAGGMIGSETVIGQPGLGAVETYTLDQKSVSGIVADTEVTIEDASVSTVDGTTVLSFTRDLNNGGEYVINLDPDFDNAMVFAYSPEGTDEFKYHSSNRGVFSITYDNIEDPNPPPGPCADGSEPVDCFVDPCESATCPGRPNAQCVPDYCGGCNFYFVKPNRPDRVVDCESQPDIERLCRRDVNQLCAGLSDPLECLFENVGSLSRRCKKGLRSLMGRHALRG